MNLNRIAIGIRVASSENYHPALFLDFSNTSLSLDSRITFTRGSQATYFDSTGTLQTAGNNVARSNAFQDYNPSTLAPLGFLIEEQRTNLFLYSAQFDDATWGKSNCTITANSVTSPAGTTTADTLTITAAGGAMNQTTQTFTAGSTVTITVFAKKNASNFMRVELGNLVNCWFNLNTGATATNSAGSGNVLFSAKSIQAINNGWYRCSVTVTTSVLTTLAVLIYATDTDNNTSSINSSIYLWGAQAEVGVFATSYIATTTAAATRLADSASITGTNFSNWFNATEGTFAIVGDYSYIATLAPGLLKVADSGSDNNRMFLAISAGTQRLSVVTAGVEVADISRSGVVAGTVFKQAAAYKDNDFASCINAGTVGTDAIGAVPTGLVALYLSRDNTFNYPNGHIQRLSYYRTRLANATLQSLTA